MSAYMCEDEHFRQLAAWLVNDDRSSLDWLARRVEYRSDYLEANELATHIARILKAENARSLRARYSDPEDMIGNEFEEKYLEPITLGEVERIRTAPLASIHAATRCYEYQACESEDWESTPAYRLVQYIYKEIGARIPTGETEPNWGTPCQFDKPAPQIVSLMSLCR